MASFRIKKTRQKEKRLNRPRKKIDPGILIDLRAEIKDMESEHQGNRHQTEKGDAGVRFFRYRNIRSCRIHDRKPLPEPLPYYHSICRPRGIR